MKKYFLAVGLSVISYLLSVHPALAQIKLGLPGLSAEPKPTEFLAQLYQFAIMISGILALGAIVYGGIKYMTAGGNPSAQGEGKEWIKSALLGLLLLFGAYFILNIVNPDLTRLALPTLTPVPEIVVSGGGGGGLPDAQARAALAAAGVIVPAGVTLAGIQQLTIDELANLKRQCSCEVAISSVTGGAHSTAGQCSHANGFKADIRPNSSIDSFITRVPAGTRQSDGAPLYRGPGGLYADERIKPPRCGTTCGWTGPHWDMAVGC